MGKLTKLEIAHKLAPLADAIRPAREALQHKNLDRVVTPQGKLRLENAQGFLPWESTNAIALLNDVGDVDANNPTNGDALTWDATTETWIPAAVSGVSYTDEMAQDAVGTILVDTASINFTYTDITPSITADIIDSYIQTLIDATNMFQTRSQRGIKKTPGVTTFTVHGYGTGSFAGTQTTADDADGPWLNSATSTTLNNTAGHAPAAATELRRDWSPDTTYAIKTAASVANIGLWVGSTSTNFTTTADPGVTFAAFRYHTTADVTEFWRCASDSASGTAEVTTTTVAVTADTKYVMRIVMSATDVKFYINGTLVATHSTKIPAATVTMGHNAGRVVNLIGGVGTEKSIKFCRFDCVHGP